jgi:hypothetical protein
MRKLKVMDDLSMIDVVDILSKLSEIDLLISVEKGDLYGKEPFSSKWISPHNMLENQELVKKLYQSVHQYLKQICEKSLDSFKDSKTIRSIQSIMMFVIESAEKIEKYTPLFKSEPALESLSDLQELRDLHEYFTSAVAPHMPSTGEVFDAWEEEWGIRGGDIPTSHRQGLRNISEIHSDKQYELFYLLQENGMPFFDYDVLRHARMVYDLDQSIEEAQAEQFFNKLDILSDRSAHMRAQKILKACWYLIDEFFKEALKYKESSCISHLVMALMGLMIAANPRNLKQTSISEKTAAEYFSDFHFFLRKALLSEEYQKLIMASHERRPFQANLYLLIHKLCHAYFTTEIEMKDMIAVIKKAISDGSTIAAHEQKHLMGFASLYQDDRALRAFMNQYPAGAIHKLAEIFTSRQQSKGFDPLSQKCIPEALFSFKQEEREILCVKMPAPIHQEYIHKADIVREFEAFLRSLSMGSKKEKILMVNMQDRTSWQDFSRCVKIEELIKREEFYGVISMAGLAKNSDFYHQTDVYQELDDAQGFMQSFKEQIFTGGQCGFFFSDDILGPLQMMLPKMLAMTHKVFFSSRAILTREDRQDFIEIVYHMIVAFALEVTKAQCVTFVDKDSVDTSSCAFASWYGLCKLCGDGSMNDEDKGMFYYLLYSSALILRERITDSDRVNRCLALLSRMQKGFVEHRALIQEMSTECPALKLSLQKD